VIVLFKNHPVYKGLEAKISGFKTAMLCNLVENRGVVHKFKIPRYLLVFTKYHVVLLNL